MRDCEDKVETLFNNPSAIKATGTGNNHTSWGDIGCNVTAC